MDQGITVTFLGGASGIGASSALVQVGDTSLLIDCGVRFKTGDALPDLDALTGKDLDAILVTHAHSDHTGALPVIHEAYPATPIYMTPPTATLVSILQRDALRLMEMASEREGEIPLYSERQVERMLGMIRPIHHGHRIVVKDLEVVYLPASHILGASMVYLSTPAGNVLFTGDYSVGAQKTVPALERPSLLVDMVVTETTYGNRLHADRRAAEKRLIQRIAEVVERKGRILIPAFAIGRAQEVLLIVKEALRRKEIPQVPVFVDGMVRSVCNVYTAHGRYVSRRLLREIERTPHPFFSQGIEAVGKPDDRKQILEASPCVIVSSSGMLSGGPSAFYAEHLAPVERDAILITGYQDEESPGRALLDLAARREGPRRLRLGEKEVDVRCTFGTYNLSAHADRIQIVGLLESLRPRSVILVHGDPEAKEALARSLSCRDIFFAEDGSRIARRYPKRRDPALQSAPEEIEISQEAIAALIGPNRGRPIRVSTLCTSWFGKKVDPLTQERFVQRLEAAGVVRRDDTKRTLLWPVAKARGNAEMSEEERVLAEELKRQNPRGRLNELCMRSGIPQPEIEEDQEHDGITLVRMHITIDGERMSSAVHRGFTKRVAEQLAARELLARIQKREGEGEGAVVPVSEEGFDPLSNPKGRLLETCMKYRLPKPTFERKPVVDGFRGKGRLPLPDGTLLESRRYQATKAKRLEQAIADDLLGQLHAWIGEQGDEARGVILQGSDAAVVRNPKMELNEMRQKGIIEAFEYRLEAQRGAAHRPIFVMRGWARLPDGSEYETEAIEATSKKEALRIVSERLLEGIRSALVR